MKWIAMIFCLLSQMILRTQAVCNCIGTHVVCNLLVSEWIFCGILINFQNGISLDYSSTEYICYFISLVCGCLLSTYIVLLKQLLWSSEVPLDLMLKLICCQEVSAVEFDYHSRFMKVLVWLVSVFVEEETFSIFPCMDQCLELTLLFYIKFQCQ